ncbi:hypothetical protein K461DRAFT_325236 [Myriangium duriaei CBS 260.36]|uniref:Uncharacterized protein n=1 Tax=Myriangium duriaei CBS 260.36 TaxID=1168546 RepID=A0A9P4IU07_9PEZI|nr:hypothetical protein K461DRAFT_325236 [Myriangium duriaei CBS 260.36]
MQPRSPRITPAPIFDLEARQVRPASVCGYVSGDPKSPLNCPSGFTCATTAKILSVFRCCNQITCQNNYQTCRNNGDPICPYANLSDDTCSSIYGSILSCPADQPVCNQYQRSSSLGASSTDIQWFCGTDTTPVLVLATTTGTGAQVTKTASAQVTDPFAALTATATDASTTNSETSQGQSSGSSSSTSTSSGHGAALSGAAIAGIIVGGVILLCGAWSIWQFCVRPRIEERRRNKRLDPHRLGATSEWVSGQSEHMSQWGGSRF